MNNSIYHLFASLFRDRSRFLTSRKLEEFPFPKRMLSCDNVGAFPDLAIRVNRDRRVFTGGELLELKDSKSMNVSSFNSTIPTGFKKIETLLEEQPGIQIQMENVGDFIHALPVRDVFYLVRGKKSSKKDPAEVVKVCLVHGKFFETVDPRDLIRKAFSQIVEERFGTSGTAIPTTAKDEFLSAFDDHHSFAQTRHVEKASVNVRFRIMTEVNSAGNILKYKDISDNTLSFLAPFYTEDEKTFLRMRMKTAFTESSLTQQYATLRQFEIRHINNGPFWVFQSDL